MGMAIVRFVLAAAVAVSFIPLAQAVVVGTLENVPTDAEIEIDGAIDDAWENAPELTVMLDKLPYKPSSGYPGMTQTQVRIKAMHDASNVYFLLVWDDPTESLNRFPWVKQPDGSWLQLSNKDDTGHENTYYEDKLALLWNINFAPFEKKGCDSACHMAENGQQAGRPDTSPGRKYTKDGATIDMWHWKSVRTNPNNQLDDQYIDDNIDPEKSGNWGRHGDLMSGGGYENNVRNGMPAFVEPDMDDDVAVVFRHRQQPFSEDWSLTGRIPGIVTGPFVGSRGDIDAKGNWEGGKWVLELRRPLMTEGELTREQDVQFDDLSKSYSFGVSVFDNSQINHLYHDGVLQMVFK